MSLPKLFQRIFWHNNTTPAINEDNLNSMSKAIDDIDDRVIALGADIMEKVPLILEKYDDIEALAENPPCIGANGNWYVWSTATTPPGYVDSGIDASITVDIEDITVLPYGQTPYVTNTGTDTDPIFHLFIPSSSGIASIAKTATSGLVDTYTITMDDGTTSTFQVTNGQDGVDGISPSVTITSITGGHEVTITDADHPTGQSFNVMDGIGDMTAAVYDSDNAVANAGGISDFVDGKIEDSLDYVTPQMYGAKGDGTTDDTQAILAALTSGNSIVYIPAGTYFVQWNTLQVQLSNGRNLTIYGAGKKETILHLADERSAVTGGGYGLSIRTGTAGTSAITIHDVGIYHDNQDSSVTYSSDNYNLLYLNGQFKTITIDNIYIHAGYNASVSPTYAKPYNTCLWGRAGADDISITNSLFENYCNRKNGGGLWWSPSDFANKFNCGHFEIVNNEIKHTNNDEAIAFWALQAGGFTDDEFNLREAVIANNTITHLNYNGDSYAADYLINFDAMTWNPNVPVRYSISNNKMITERSKLSVIRVANLVGVNISDNDIRVLSLLTTSSTPTDPITTWAVINALGGKVVFKHNSFNCSATVPNNSNINISTQCAILECIENVFVSTVWMKLQSWSSSDHQPPMPDKDNVGTTFNFIGNVLENISLGMDAVSNNTRFNIINNVINGNFVFAGTNTSGSYLTLKGNQFRYRNGNIYERELKGRDVQYVMNHGIRLVINSATITSAMDNFVYVGRKEDLVFKVNNAIVPDSPSVRARFFTASDISYIGEDSSIVLAETLAANATSVTFTGLPITGNHIIRFYIEDGANYTAINTTTSGQVTLTYDAVSSARAVYCTIEEV